MKAKLFHILINAFVTLTLTSCESNFGEKLAKSMVTPAPYVPTVYIGGQYYDSATTLTIPCYWTGTTRHALPCSNKGFVNGIFVAGSSIYTAGTDDDGSANTACYWVNDTRKNLSKTNPFAFGTGIFVSNATVYVCGYINNSGGHPYPCYWINDTDRVDFTDSGCAYSIFVKDSKIYTAGFVGSISLQTEASCYWIGSTKTSFTLTSRSIAKALTVTASNILSTGFGHTNSPDGIKPVQFTDTSYSVLYNTNVNSTDNTGTGITVSGSDIIICGQYSIQIAGTPGTKPCIWINGSSEMIELPTKLTGNFGTTTGIAVMNSIIYVSGNYQKDASTWIPCYWTITLDADRTVKRHDLQTTDGQATCIFLK